MKKVILSVFMLMSLTYSMQAQEVVSKNAIGLRLGDNDGFGGEISYQRQIFTNNRLEFDLGWRNSKNVDAVKLTGLYQWFWNIDKGFYWYVGVGGGAGSWRHDYNLNNGNGNDNIYYEDSGAFAFAAGDIGIEYNFKIPIQVAIDFRPELYFNSDDFREDSFGPDVALSVRYKF
ncbi:MAG: hypothetical protein V4648_08360 [Bacteroidota bacterium]